MSGKTAPINIVQLQFLYHQYMIVDVLKKVDVISCIIYRYFPATHVLPAGTWFALSLWQKLVAFRLFMESMALLRSRATRRWSRQFSTPVRHATSGSTQTSQNVATWCHMRHLRYIYIYKYINIHKHIHTNTHHVERFFSGQITHSTTNQPRPLWSNGRYDSPNGTRRWIMDEPATPNLSNFFYIAAAFKKHVWEDVPSGKPT